MRCATVWPQETLAGKWGLMCPLQWRGKGPHLTQCGIGRGLQSGILIHSAVWPQETLAEKWGATVPLWWKLGRHHNRMWHGLGPSSAPIGILIHKAVVPKRHASKSGGLMCVFRRELSPESPQVTQCRLGQSLPPYQLTSSSIQPFGHNRHGPKIWGSCTLLVSWVPI